MAEPGEPPGQLPERLRPRRALLVWGCHSCCQRLSFSEKDVTFGFKWFPSQTIPSPTCKYRIFTSSKVCGSLSPAHPGGSGGALPRLQAQEPRPAWLSDCPIAIGSLLSRVHWMECLPPVQSVPLHDGPGVPPSYRQQWRGRLMQPNSQRKERCQM